ncbi:MAG: hypothetical protein WC149_04360 [Arcobacteraceae bacterium]
MKKKKSNILHPDIKGVHFILKNKYPEVDFKDDKKLQEWKDAYKKYREDVKKTLLQNWNDAYKKYGKYENFKEVNFEIPYLYRTTYQDWWELQQFMILFDLDISDDKQRRLSYEIIKEFGDSIPILMIGIEQKYFDEFKLKIEEEFKFIDELFKFCKNRFPTQRKRAIPYLKKELKHPTEKFISENMPDYIKAIEVLEFYSLNNRIEAKVYLFSKLLHPYILPNKTQETLINLLKLK